VRIIIALLLAVLLVFPESVALAQDIRCTASTGWNTSGAPLPNPIETFGVALNGTTMYVIGGYNNTGTGSQLGAQTVVLHKSVGGVASLGSSMWQFSNSLWKDPTFNDEVVGLSRDLCGVVYNSPSGNNYLYTIGGVYYDSHTPVIDGVNHGTTTNKVSYAQILPSGSLGGWTSATALPVALQLHGAVVFSNYLYVFGGSTYLNDSMPSTKVTNKYYYAPINNDGSIGSFATGNLPTDATNTSGNRYKTCPVVVGSKIYIAGGENGNGALQTAYFATQQAGGTLTWTQTTSLTMTDAAQAVVYNNGIILIAGDQTGHAGGDWPCVYRGTPSGATVSWNINRIPQLPINVSRNAGATSGTTIFSLGGSEGGIDQPTIYYRTAP